MSTYVANRPRDKNQSFAFCQWSGSFIVRLEQDSAENRFSTAM